MFDKNYRWLKANKIRIMQNSLEFDTLLCFLKAYKVRSFIEIGSRSGGSLYMFTNNLSYGNSQIISIDIRLRDALQRVLAELRERFSNIKFIQGDSCGPDVIAEVKDTLEKPVDFLFIDAEMDYESVKENYTNFQPFVRKGGLIVFHDIATKAIKTKNDGLVKFGTHKFWREIRKKYHGFAIKQMQGWRGLGVIINE